MPFLLLAWTAALGEAPFDPGPPLSPEASLAAIRVPGDVVVELVAAEPMVVDPAAMAFDERGRLFVCEFRDYPTGPADPAGPTLSRVKMLVDQDGDGRMDASAVFADRLPYCQGLAVWGDGLIVTVANKILHLRDLDGDGVADERRVLFEGLGMINSQLQPACPRFGPDGWIYVTNGLSGGEIRRPGDSKSLPVPRSDFRFHPHTLVVEPATGLGQFGNAFDDFGNRFSSSNRNPAMHEVLPWSVLSRDPRPNKPAGYWDVVPAGAESRVYPIAETNTTAASHLGTHSAACGVEACRGDWLGPDYRGDLFICEPTAHLVTRSKLTPDGATFRSERILQDGPEPCDWLASGDRWFRPVALANGPDGALYLADMYRAVIEHPQYIPKGPPLAVDLRAGDDRGRIYRIRPRAGSARPYKPFKNLQEAAAMLDDPNGWRRDAAVRILADAHHRDPRSVPPAARGAVDPSRLARLIWAPQRDPSGRVERRPRLLVDPTPSGRERYLKFLAELDRPVDDFQSAWILACASDPDKRVRWRAAAALRLVPDGLAAPALAERLRVDGDDPWIASAVFSSIGARATAVLNVLTADPRFTDGESLAKCDLLTSLARIAAAAEGSAPNVEDLVDALLPPGAPAPIWWRLAVLAGILEHSPSNLAAAASSHEPQDGAPAAAPARSHRLRAWIDAAGPFALDDSLPVAARVCAAKVAASAEDADVLASLASLLAFEAPLELQEVVFDAVRRRDRGRLAGLLVDRWRELPPRLRARVLDLAVERAESVPVLLSAAVESRIPLAALTLRQRQILLQAAQRLPSGPSRDAAMKLLGDPVSEDRRAVVESYRTALNLHGDPARGREVFRKSCGICHRYGLEGTAVGPDLSDIRVKSAEQLLMDVLDPNQVVEPRFAATTILLSDGRTLSGLLTNQSPSGATLLQAGGVETTVEPNEIDEIRFQDKSLMPEGVEKEISVQDMADLLKFLRSGS
jgi:putative membrane-bound dehydrogenase-like protein